MCIFFLQCLKFLSRENKGLPQKLFLVSDISIYLFIFNSTFELTKSLVQLLQTGRKKTVMFGYSKHS